MSNGLSFASARPALQPYVPVLMVLEIQEIKVYEYLTISEVFLVHS